LAKLWCNSTVKKDNQKFPFINRPHTNDRHYLKPNPQFFQNITDGSCVCFTIKNYLQILNTKSGSSGETYFVLWYNKLTLFCGTTNLLCSAAQQTYFVLCHNKLTLFCGTTNPLTISAAPWNCPYGRSDCRRCKILWPLFESKVFSWRSACSYFRRSNSDSTVKWSLRYEVSTVVCWLNEGE